MSEILSEIIKDKVFKEEEIQNISLHSSGEKAQWLFDFKGVALSDVFLKEYARVFWEKFGSARAIQVGGMESGAIPLVVGISVHAPASVEVNPFYIRKSRKKSDLANQVEGELKQDTPIVLVDDIINNGNTIKKEIAILKEQGQKVEAVFTCLRFRDMATYKEITEQGIRIESIFELNDLSGVLPVKNLEMPSKDTLAEPYQIDYKVTLTKHPNLYAVIPKSGPILSDDYLFMGADDGTFYCLSKKDGSVLWTYKVPFGAGGKRIFSTCAIWKDHVMFGAYDGNLYCLDKNTGKLVWVFMDGDWIGSSPSVDQEGGTVFIGLEFGLFSKQGGVAAIDIKTGKAKWKYYSMKGLTHASPTYNAKHGVVVCGCNDNCIYALDAKSGKLLWKFETKGEVKYGAAFDDSRGLVVIGSMDGSVYAISMKDGVLYHRFETRAGIYSTPLVENERVYVGSLDKRVYCFDQEKKDAAWYFETRGRIFSSPISDGDSLFIGSNDGAVYEIDKYTGKMKNSIQLTERIVNRIQIDNEHDKRTLYVGTHLCELYKLKEA